VVQLKQAGSGIGPAQTDDLHIHDRRGKASLHQLITQIVHIDKGMQARIRLSTAAIPLSWFMQGQA
jgi:hypothetical protein